VLLGALGVGAVLGALTLGRLRGRLSVNGLLLASGLVFTAVLAAVVLIPNEYLVLAVLLPAGVAWIAVLSTINAELQLFLPAWVRARGLSVYQMLLFGSQAFASLLWGVLAEALGLVPTFLIAAMVMAGGVATMRLWPLVDTSEMDRSTVRPWPDPNLVFDLDPATGPVVVETVYTVASEREQQFLEAMAELRLVRMRTGATRWGLFRDGETAHRFVELFTVPSWDEHLRQHGERLTGFGHQVQERANALSDPPPETSHLIAATDGTAASR
jgi:MFS family permease